MGDGSESGEPVSGEQAGGMEGVRIIQASWASVVLFAAVAVPAAYGVDALDRLAATTSLTLFLVSLPIWVYAFLKAVARTARGDDVAVASLFFLQGSAPRDVRWHLMGALAACLVVTVATAAADPFGVLVPMMPLGLAGLWGARHGRYPPRPTGSPRRSNGRPGQ